MAFVSPNGTTPIVINGTGTGGMTANGLASNLLQAQALMNMERQNVERLVEAKELTDIKAKLMALEEKEKMQQQEEMKTCLSRIEGKVNNTEVLSVLTRNRGGRRHHHGRRNDDLLAAALMMNNGSNNNNSTDVAAALMLADDYDDCDYDHHHRRFYREPAIITNPTDGIQTVIQKGFLDLQKNMDSRFAGVEKEIGEVRGSQQVIDFEISDLQRRVGYLEHPTEPPTETTPGLKRRRYA